MPVKIEILVSDKKAASRIRNFAKQAGADVTKLEKQTVQSSKRMSTAFQGVGSTLGALGIGLGVGIAVKGLKSVIQTASDTEESLNKVREVFGRAAGSVERFSQTAAAGLGASRQEALAMTGELGNLLVAFGFTEKKAADMSTEMVQLAADLGSFNNVPTVEALNAIRSALVGETEPMRRFGATISVARLEAIALGEGLEFTKGKMDAQTKALTSMKAILLDTKKAQGDFKRTSDGLANSSKIMEANFKDLASELGTELIPFAKVAVSSLTDLARGVKDVITGFTSGQTVDIAKSFGMKEWIAAAVRGVDHSNVWALEVIANSEKVRQANEKAAKATIDKWAEAFSFTESKGKKGGKPTEEDPATKRELALRQEILASLKLQEDKLRIINQLKTEGLIPLSEEEKKQKAILLAMQESLPVLEVLGKSHLEITEALSQSEMDINFAADNQARWTEEAAKTRGQILGAAAALNDIVQLASGARKFSLSGLLSIGAGIASIIPGGQGIALGLQAGAIATRGLAGGGRPVTGRPNIVGERGPEAFVPDAPGRIVPNSEINSSQKIDLHFNFNVADEMTIKTKVIPIINDFVSRQGGKLLSSGVV